MLFEDPTRKARHVHFENLNCEIWDFIEYKTLMFTQSIQISFLSSELQKQALSAIIKKKICTNYFCHCKVFEFLFCTFFFDIGREYNNIEFPNINDFRRLCVLKLLFNSKISFNDERLLSFWMISHERWSNIEEKLNTWYLKQTLNSFIVLYFDFDVWTEMRGYWNLLP